MANAKFRLGAKVTYRTHRPPSTSGTGEVAFIHETQRGLWYEVQPTAPRGVEVKPVRVRVSGLALV